MRIRAGLTGAALARQAGISAAHLSNIEAGRVGVSPPVLKALADVLGVDMNSLAPGLGDAA